MSSTLKPLLIGFDGSKLSVAHKTGTEHYTDIILNHLLAVDQDNQYRIYTNQPITNNYSHRAEIWPITYPRLWTQVGLAKEVWLRQPDVLFIPAHTMPIVHKPSLKTVVTIHDLGYEYLPQYHQFPDKLYLNRTTEFAAGHASHLIAVSKFTKQDLIHKLHVPADRITVVYEGIDTQPYHQLTNDKIVKVKQKYKLQQPYILFIGTIQPRKNLVRLIEAFAHIADRHPDLQLVLAGGKGWLSDEIYAAPNRLDIADRVKFLGYIDEDEKPALYAGAQVGVLVSLFEGFGLPLLESMAAGTPVVAANGSSLPEVVGKAGVLVDPTNSHSIADALHQLLSQPNMRQQLVSAGYEQIKKFSWDDAARQTLAVLEKTARS